MDQRESQPYFELIRARFGYARGREIIHDLSLSIPSGQMAALIGPNGAGKSTLVQMMCGLLTPTAGEARLCGEEVTGMEPARRARKVAFVPQASRIFFPYTVDEIVAMGRHPHLRLLGDFTSADREKIEWALEITGTREFAGRMFNHLSGGESQRVVLARALAQDAPALLLDEPSASLDLFYQTALYGLLERLNREHGLTILIVTHDINLAAEYCPRLIGLREGRIIADGPPAQVVSENIIHELYGVSAQIIASGGGRMVRVRRDASGRDK